MRWVWDRPFWVKSGKLFIGVAKIRAMQKTVLVRTVDKGESNE